MSGPTKSKGRNALLPCASTPYIVRQSLPLRLPMLSLVIASIIHLELFTSLARSPPLRSTTSLARGCARLPQHTREGMRSTTSAHARGCARLPQHTREGMRSTTSAHARGRARLPPLREGMRSTTSLAERGCARLPQHTRGDALDYLSTREKKASSTKAPLYLCWTRSLDW